MKIAAHVTTIAASHFAYGQYTVAMIIANPRQCRFARPLTLPMRAKPLFTGVAMTVHQ